MIEVRTARLLLRRWREADLVPFAALNADAAVRRYFPGVLDRAESDAAAGRIRAHFDRFGFGFWAVETEEAPFVGFVGLQHVTFPAPFTPAVEAGWRLGRSWWGRGYASEAAQAVLAEGFGALGFGEIVAFTVPENLASRRVMEGVGMVRDEDGDFEHPGLPMGSLLRRHVLYRARRRLV